MARVTHVKKAQQRYGTKPVLDADGKPKRTPVMKTVKDRETGETTQVQKTTRDKPGRPGRPVFMTVTERDLDHPKPLYRCDSCGKDIEIGTPYKHMSPKSGPYGGRKLTRHESCPTWQVWEYSNSWSARIAQATHDFDVTNAETTDDVQSALDDVAAAIKELAEESREAAGNIEEGFGHATSQSEEAESRADELDNWADEISGVDIPELPEPELRWFVTNGDGVASDLFEADGYDSESEAEQALAMHRDDNDEEPGEDGEFDDGFEVEEITPDEPTEEQLNDWRDEVVDACSIVDESPV
jgi:hypothetical protein